MRQRIALFAASLTASLVLAGALAAAGVSPGTVLPATTGTTTTDVAPTDPSVQVDTVYLAAPEPQQTVVVHQAAPGEDGEGAEVDD